MLKSPPFNRRCLSFFWKKWVWCADFECFWKKLVLCMEPKCFQKPRENQKCPRIFSKCPRILKNCHRLCQKCPRLGQILKSVPAWVTPKNATFSLHAEKTLTIKNTSRFWFKKVGQFSILKKTLFLVIFRYRQILFAEKAFGVDQNITDQSETYF